MPQDSLPTSVPQGGLLGWEKRAPSVSPEGAFPFDSIR